jgi:hypothetical protein
VLICLRDRRLWSRELSVQGLDRTLFIDPPAI